MSKSIIYPTPKPGYHNCNYDIFHDEHDVVLWVLDNYKKLGLKNILKVRWREFPDIIARDKKGNKVRIEVEYNLTNFFIHGHISFVQNKLKDIVDIVICWSNDLRKPFDPNNEVKVIEIQDFVKHKLIGKYDRYLETDNSHPKKFDKYYG